MSTWRNSLYISIDAQLKGRNVLSGKYNFHSLYKNIPAYVREGVPNATKYYLVYYSDNSGKWYFQNGEEFCFLKPESMGGGYFCLQTKGNDVHMCKA